MAVNYYSPDKEIEIYKARILEKRVVSGRRGKRDYYTVKIRYLKQKKELDFRSSEIDRINEADSVIMEIKKGNLGFDIIARYDVMLKDSRVWR